MTNPSLEYASDGTILRHPDRPEPKYSLPKAVHHFGNLMRDKEDTSEVFKIFEALPPKDYIGRVRNFAMSARGEELRKSEPNLPDILDDHATIRKTPKGSVGHAYCDFMEREGLSAAGLVAEFDKMGRPKFDDLTHWYLSRSRDTHDLFHILTGYGRDALGEQCVLLFTHGQSPSHGHLLIGYAGALNIKKQVWGSKAPIFGAVNEARRTGSGAPKLIEQSIRDLLAMNLQEARAMLKIPEPYKYRECHRIWAAEGIDPYGMLASENTPEAVAA